MFRMVRLSLVAALLTACGDVPVAITEFIGATPALAARGEQTKLKFAHLGSQTVRAELIYENGTRQGLSVVVDRAAQQALATLPGDAPGGQATLNVQVDGSSFSRALTVLGDVVGGEAVVVTAASADTNQVRGRVEALGFGIIGAPRGLGQACGGSVLRLDLRGAPLGQSIEQLRDLPGVRYADANARWKADPTSLWSTGNIGEVYSYMLEPILENPANFVGGGDGVIIAVLDTGVNEVDLGGRLLDGRNFTSSDETDTADRYSPPAAATSRSPLHGTSVARFAAGDRGGAEPGGLARRAEVLPVKVCDDAGLCQTEPVIRGICYALESRAGKAMVLNLSFGGDTPVTAVTGFLQVAVSAPLNVPVAVAAGNEAPNASQGQPASLPHYPARENIPGMVVVGAATGANGLWRRAPTSRRGSGVDLVAPGIRTATNVTLDDDGTSFATGAAAGVLALYRAACPFATPVALEARLVATASLAQLDAQSRSAVDVGKGMLRVPAKLVCPPT